MTEFEKTLKKVKLILGVTKDSAVANAIDMKPSAFANRKKSNSVPYSHYMTILKSYNVNFNWFVYDEGPIYKDNSPQSEASNVHIKADISESEKDGLVVIKHRGLVTEFTDQPRALNMNSNLLKIEKKNKRAFRDMDKYIEGVVSGLEYNDENENNIPENQQKKSI